jgi:chemotaxis protein MotB
MRRLTAIYITSIALLSTTACVNKKLFYNEQLARKGAEGQVTVLSKELFERKREVATGNQEIADLNRKIGAIEKEMADLHAEVARRTETLSASSERLMGQKRELEIKLESTLKTLEAREAELKDATARSSQMKNTLSSDYGALESALANIMQSGVKVDVLEDHLEVMVQDQILFGSETLRLGPSAPGFLMPFSAFLADRPAYKVQVHAHVDNQIPPRQKEVNDTWSFSQARALNIVRTMVSNYNVNAYMLAPVARGEYAPVSTNSTPEGRAENRRTVFYIYTK